MKIFKTDKVFLPIIIFLIIQNYISSELFFVLGLLYVLYYIIFKNRKKVCIPFKEYKILILFFVWGSILGGFYYLTNSSETIRDVIRDVFYFLNPLVYIYIGAIYAKQEVDIYKILNAFIIASGILCVIQLGNTVIEMPTLISKVSIQDWRNITGDGIMVASMSLAIILAGMIPKEKRLSKIVNNFIFVIMLIEFLITLSRTNLLIFSITYIIFVFNNKNYKKIIIFAVCTCAIGIVTYNLLPSEIINSYIDKLLSTKDEISANHTWATKNEIQGNWRGYETYSAMEEWKQATIMKKIFGHGFGKRIYVGEYAYTLLKQTDASGNPIETIAVLHNGYATMLIKLGVLGVIIYVAFYIKLIVKAIKGEKNEKIVENKILFVMTFILLIQTYFLNGLYKDVCFYPIIILIGYSGYVVQKRLNNKNELKKERAEICNV